MHHSPTNVVYSDALGSLPFAENGLVHSTVVCKCAHRDLFGKCFGGFLKYGLPVYEFATAAMEPSLARSSSLETCEQSVTYSFGTIWFDDLPRKK